MNLLFKDCGKTYSIKFTTLNICQRTTQWHLTHSLCCVIITLVHGQHVFIISNGNSDSTKRLPFLQVTTTLFCVFMYLVTPGTLYKWNHPVRVLLCLAYFTSHKVFGVRPCCSTSEFPSFLKVNSIIPNFCYELGLEPDLGAKTHQFVFEHTGSPAPCLGVRRTPLPLNEALAWLQCWAKPPPSWSSSSRSSSFPTHDWLCKLGIPMPMTVQAPCSK